MSYTFSKEDQEAIAEAYFNEEVQFYYDVDDDCMRQWMEYADIPLTSEEAIDAFYEYVDPYNLSQFIDTDICIKYNTQAHLHQIVVAMARLETVSYTHLTLPTIYSV